MEVQDAQIIIQLLLHGAEALILSCCSLHSKEAVLEPYISPTGRATAWLEACQWVFLSALFGKGRTELLLFEG